VVGELLLAHSRCGRLRVRVVRSLGASTSLAKLRQAAYIGMSLSYIVMLIAFYVDNGKQLPIVAPEAGHAGRRAQFPKPRSVQSARHRYRSASTRSELVMSASAKSR